MNPFSKHVAAYVLLAGDLIALLFSVLIGEIDHDTVNTAQPFLGLVLGASVFIAPWIAAGWALGALRFEGVEPVSRAAEWLGRTLNAWLVAGLLALLLRALVLGRAVIPTLFIVVALGMGGLFIFAWRILFLLVWKSVLQKRFPSQSKSISDINGI